jgi:LysM repeat protein
LTNNIWRAVRLRFVLALALVLGALAPASASAAFLHVVAPGESLTSIAAADGLTVSQLAAANGLPSDAQIQAGTNIAIPPQLGPVASTAVTSSASSAGAGQPAGDGDDDSDDPSSTSAAAAPATSAGYVVQPGDTLTAIAARAGTTVAQLAAANGIDPNGPLLIGTVLHVSGAGSALPSASSQPVGAAAEGSSSAPPYPTAETVTPGEVGSIAAANGVPPSLANAIAYQESGFNNNEVSSADARGVMQILPGTWSWIQQTLVPGGPPLGPASAADNVRAGVLLLRSLLNSSGGDPALAAAGYYQGWSSVQQNGMFPSTQQYVNDVMSLAPRFGGG